METRETHLIKNTLIFALGNFGSKVLQIILVPFYTRVLTSSEYGVVDILQALVALLLPIISVAIYEAVFRYAMDKEYDKYAVLSVGISINAIGNLIMVLLGIGFMQIFDPTYVWLVIINTSMVALWTLFSQYTKAIGKSLLYSVNNIVLTAAVLIFNILFLTIFRWGIEGYMLGYILANFVATVMLIIALKKDIRVDFKSIERKLVIEMLIFSIPLVLNGICWWLSNFTDRMMITSMLGSSENGLYAASSKIPHLVSVVVTVFCQAWQISANEEFDSEDRSSFYSKIYNELSGYVFIMASFLIIFCRPLNIVILGKNYYTAWVIMPVLTLASTFFAFAAFLLSIYSANKSTTMAFVTNLICVVVNVVLNYLFILKWKTVGAAIATAVAYAILWMIRIIDTKRILAINYDFRNILIATAIVVVQAVLVCMDRDYVITYLLCGVGTLIILFLYRAVLLRGIMYAVNISKKFIGKRK